MELTTKQRKRAEQLKDLINKGDLAILKYLFDIEDMIEEKVEEMSKSIKPLSESQMEMLEKIAESVYGRIKLENKGEDGKDYELTDEDKEEIKEKVKKSLVIPTPEEIAKFVKVPIVEKVIEKTEVIKEVPIITNEVKEVAVPNTPEQTRDQLESLPEGEKLSIQAIQDLVKELEELKEMIRVASSKRSGGGLSSIALQSKFIDDETPSGTIDGSNQTFTLANTPIPSSLKVYRGGARQRVTEDYTLSGRTITFTLAPQVIDSVEEIILVDYRII